MPVITINKSNLAIISWIFCLIASFANAAPVHKSHGFEISGDLMQGGLAIIKVSDNVKSLKYNDKPIKIYDGVALVGFNRDDEAKQRLTVDYKIGVRKSFEVDITQREYEVQRINKLASKMVTPPDTVYDRIVADNNAVKNARNNVKESCDYYAEEWKMPAEGRISGVYGSGRILNGTPKQPHYGLDIAAPKGTVVRAPKSGVVSLTHQDMYYTGKTVVVDHGCGLTSTFIHLDEILVKKGDFVQQGQVFAKIGSTGRATGPHLDWRVNLKNTRLDPQLLID